MTSLDAHDKADPKTLIEASAAVDNNQERVSFFPYFGVFFPYFFFVIYKDIFMVSLWKIVCHYIQISLFRTEISLFVTV